jgi:serine/threonine protein phosphatase PrpC
MNAFLQTAAGNPENQDRGAVIHCGSRLVLVVADGAGGRSGGTEAAIMAVEMIRQQSETLETADACVDLLQKLDRAIEQDRVAGETTCVITVWAGGAIYGASAGDSGAWLISPNGTPVHLTAGQQRKPFIGSGSAWPVPFCHQKPNGLLLLATDGLLKYTSIDRISEICRSEPPEVSARNLIELVRYPSGKLPDDVTLILGRI